MSDEKTQPGRILDQRFVLKNQLGGGGAATVWRATDLATGEDVALKLLHPRYRGIDEAHERLAREASLLASFHHPHIARARAFELSSVQPYFVMSLIEGESMEDELAARSAVDNYFTWPELLRLTEQIVSAVDYAHGRGVIHRDLKPSNLMLDATVWPHEVRILDFGIAKMLGAHSRNPTTQGRVMGTGFYMSPEQARGDPVDARADIFALGVLLFEMTTLRRAWVRNDRGGPVRAFAEPARRNEFNTPGAILSRISEEMRPRPSNFRPGLTGRIDSALVWALAIDPADRPPTAKAFLDELAMAISLAGPDLEPVATLEDPAPPKRSVDATWSRSHDPGVVLIDPLEASAPTAEAPQVERPAAADGATNARESETGPTQLGPSPSPAMPAMPEVRAGQWHERLTTVGGADAPVDIHATARIGVAEPPDAEMKTQTQPFGSVKIVVGEPPLDPTPPLSPDPAGTQAPPTQIYLEPTALVGQPGRASPSLADAPRSLKIAVVTVGVLTMAALLVLVGYQLGRRTSPPPRRAGLVTRPIDPVSAPVPPPLPFPQPQVVAPKVLPPPIGRAEKPAPEVSKNRRRRPRRKKASRPPPPLPAPAEPTAKPLMRFERSDRVLAHLRRMMRRMRTNPGDLSLLSRLGKGIEDGAKHIKDPAERTRVRRIARSSAMLGDTDGVDQALKALASALADR